MQLGTCETFLSDETTVLLRMNRNIFDTYLLRKSSLCAKPSSMSIANQNRKISDYLRAGKSRDYFNLQKSSCCRGHFSFALMLLKYYVTQLITVRSSGYVPVNCADPGCTTVTSLDSSHGNSRRNRVWCNESRSVCSNILELIV